jgi:predicted ATPase/signal transduction histidine kinase
MAIGGKWDHSSVDLVSTAKASQVELRASPANVEVYDLNELSDLAGEAITDLSAYALERLRGDTEFVLYRARSDADTRHILVLAPASEQPSYSTLKRIEHEYALRTELDPAWAVLPFALVRDKGRTLLALKDPGGQPLDRLLERPLELKQFLRVAIALAAALSRLHERGIIHKDIKPANVMVSQASDEVWLTGFGIATDSSRERQAPTPPQIIAGTLAYMAPEQTGRMNRSIDSRSDLYSLGVTLYQMLTSALPFTASDPVEWVYCHVARQPSPPEERRKDVPAALSAIVLKLLAKSAEERYQTAAGLQADLKRCLDDLERLGRIEPFVTGARDVSDRLTIPEEVYGRERETTALLDAFDRVVASGAPELVLVSGHSGIGKSSIVNELHKAIVLPRGIFVSGKFDQYKRDIPYATLARAFQTLIRQILSRNEAEVGRRRDALRDAIDPNGQLLVNLIPELELIIGKQAPVPELSAQDAENRFQWVFRAFVGVFARKEHPLALFLDDLQWLDAATLNLIEHLIIHPDVRHLLLIGAYRDNEVIASHPLMLMLDSLRKSSAAVRDIVLTPLSIDHVGQLTADSVRQERALTEPLARLVYEKTAGNPFFVVQFLTALAEERLLEFDSRAAVWRWDVDRIRVRGITDNVVDLLIGKLNRLPDNTREALKQLACLGNRANTTTLVIVHGRSEEETHSDLKEGVREGFVVLSDGSYEFVHDRVHEAAYSLVPEEDRARVHLQIGRRLIAAMPADKIAERIFNLVNQFNRGVALISDPNEKQRVAELNLLAARRARASMAYAGACIYASAGMGLLGREPWETCYALAFSLWLLRAECEFLCGNFQEAEGFISELLERAASKADKAAAYRLRIDLQMIKSEHTKAVDTALECLHLFAIQFSVHPTWEQVRTEYEKVWQTLAERSIESLIDLPIMTDQEIQAVMQLLSVLQAPAFFTDNNLLYVCLCYMVNLSLQYGVTDASAHGFAYFGLILGSVFHRYADGYRFGKLAIDLIEKHKSVAYKSKAYFTIARVVIWTRSVAVALDLIEAAFRAALEAGDLTYACYCCAYIVTHPLLRGDRLDDVWRESEKCLHFVRKAKFRDYEERIVSQQQFIQCMRGETSTFSTFSDTNFDEASFEAQLTGDRAMVCWYWILKLQARFISGDHEAAIAAAQKAKALLWTSTGCIQLLDYHYFTALVIAAAFEKAPQERQREWRQALSAHVEQLREWTDNNPATFADKHALVTAELARIDGRDRDAMRLYDQAIRSARDNGFIQNEAVANEVAGRFFLERGLEAFGRTYLRNARSCYLGWGARGKVKQLDQLYQGLEEHTPPEATRTTATMGSTIEQLDLTTVVKALQAVSREIDREKLNETLMASVVQHAGAERGLLFLPRGSEYAIEAQATTRSNTVEVILADSFAAPPEFPEAILNYAIRTRENVILEDASAPNQFSDDAYVLARRPRSILCLPLAKRRELIGVLYLENNLAPCVFTPRRLAVLELLASQAAISLKNAQLYADLREENIERRKAEEELRQSTHALHQLQEEVRQASRAAMMGELTASLAHELNQPLGAILSNAQAARRLLAGKKPNVEEANAALDDVIRDDARAADIIRNIRALFQRNKVEMSLLDLRQILLDVEHLLRSDASTKEISFRLDLPPSLPTVVGNRTQLIEVLINLVSNAFDSLRESADGRHEVELCASQREAARVHIAVRDSGKGIDPETMPRLFDAFFTTKPKGMGMGLTIARSIIENHGGRLWATRNPDRGATLEFELPVKVSAESKN